jgi:hypothetical protein
MTNPSRRFFLTGLVTTPAVLRLGLYMPVRQWIEESPTQKFLQEWEDALHTAINPGYDHGIPRFRFHTNLSYSSQFRMNWTGEISNGG